MLIQFESMINKYGTVVVDDFTMIIVSMFKLIHQRLKKIINDNPREVEHDVILSLAIWIKTF